MHHDTYQTCLLLIAGTPSNSAMQQGSHVAAASAVPVLPILPSAMVANTPAEDLPAAFVGACKTEDVVMVCELLALEGGCRVDVHRGRSTPSGGHARRGHLGVVLELLALTGTASYV